MNHRILIAACALTFAAGTAFAASGFLTRLQQAQAGHDRDGY